MKSEIRTLGLCALLAFLLTTEVNAVLTQAQLDEFQSGGTVETNTGETGFVTIEEGTRDDIEVYILRSNGIPDHATGTFPDPPDYLYSLSPQTYTSEIPRNPAPAAIPSCLPEGPIGFALNGVPFYNALNDVGENVVEGIHAEPVDVCQGRPDSAGRYHYRTSPTCIAGTVTPPGQPSPVIGIAMDGYLIYGSNDEFGNLLTVDNLDQCNGRVNSQGVYQYHVTPDYPYVIGCFRGSPIWSSGMIGSGDCYLTLNTRMENFTSVWPQFASLPYGDNIPVHWETSEWQACIVTCGQGVQTRTASCHRSDNDDIVADGLCGFWRQPILSRSCNLPLCPAVEAYTYIIGEWGACSATCGNSYRTRPVSCVQQSSNAAVDNSFCQNAGLTRPTDYETCTVPQCEEAYSYYVSSWGVCSVTCGTGVRTRLVVCYDAAASQQVSSDLCINAGLGVAPATSEPCNTNPCESLSFVVGEWGACSATCGTSVRSRSVTCYQDGSTIVDNSLCVAAGLTTPTSSELCSVPACVSYSFTVSEWGSCSATCGNSFRSRSVSCRSNTNAIVDNSLCQLAGLTVPASVEICSVPNCVNYFFVVGNWGQCSATCGTSFRTRQVTCYQDGTIVVDNSLCNAVGLATPASTELCTVPSCVAYSVTVGEWGQCSATCGISVRTRTVTCINQNDGSVIDSAVCVAEGLTLPVSVETCAVPTCVEYYVGNYGECSATCGSAFRQRDVYCVSLGTTSPVDNSLCTSAGLSAPTSIEVCTVPACVTYVYVTANWGECSATCGVSIRTRSVTCVEAASGDVVNDAFCTARGLTRPTSQETCTVPACVDYSFIIGEWGACSATCGTSVRSRTVTCVEVNSGNTVANTVCVANGLEIPAAVELCTSVPACPIYGFDVGSWSECSATCGSSFRVRNVQCLEQVSGAVVDDSFCTQLGLIRPTGQEECIVPDCVSFLVGLYGECSATCGTSVRTRTVTCVLAGTDTAVDQAQCIAAGLIVPDAVETCVVPDCYTYNVGGWGECSATCGTSFRTRTVSCVVTGTITPVDGTNCVAAGLTLPTSVELCTVSACPVYAFDVGTWSECSATCGSSFRVRTVECRELTTDTLVDDSLCLNINLIRPTAQEECIVPDCLVFTVGEWGTCSATCGTSVRTRTVTCVAVGTDVVVDQAQCLSAGLTIPSAVENCVVPDCYTYSISAWGECSATCGSSFRTRTVTCVVSGTTTVVDDSNCVASGLTAPTAVEVCAVGDCPIYVFESTEWSECSATCGNSIRVRTVTCREHLFDVVVDDSFCFAENLVKPTAQEQCIVPDCVQFTVGEWGECSATCGTSVRTRTVTCVAVGTNVVVDQAQCESALLTIPSAVENCVVPDCYTYSIGAWGECSATCGTSFRIRTVSCVVSGTTDPVDSSNCAAAGLTLPTSVELCTVPACPVYAFDVSSWSECSATCGSSVRVRTVECREQTTDTLVDDSLCLNINLIRPTAQEECVVPDCVVFTVGEWGECSATCGTSTRTRAVTCVLLGTDTVVDQIQCLSAGLIAPSAVESCVVPDCYVYSIGAWGECTATCDTSFRIRTVSCVVVGSTVPVDNANCVAAGLVIPTQVELCTVPACPVYSFEVGAWSECSATCGISIRARTVECRELTSDTLVDDTFCLERNLVRPTSQEECVVPDCVEFTITAWGECSATCGTSVRTRTVTCVVLGTDTVVDEVQCTAAGIVAPTSVEDCVVPDCHSYNVGVWGECSATCGTSFRTRTVSCVVTGTNEPVDNNNCLVAGLTLPSSVELCTVPACPVYGFEVGTWSECSATCGVSIRARTVECFEQTTGTLVDDSFCLERNLVRPDAQENCLVPDCVEFTVGPWGECSATCGTSSRTRAVTCVILGTDTVVDQSQCTSAGLVAPISVESCVVPDCYTFTVGEWGECSATCGTSFRTRSVSCTITGTTTVVDSGNCVASGLTQPIQVELCTVPVCPVYGFEVGAWSECSATCGTSFRARTVECREQTTNTVVDDSFCTERNLLRPSDQEECIVPDCVQFIVGEYGECSATCGVSTRTRSVTCVVAGTNTVVDQTQCLAAGLALPTSVETCVVPECFSYSISEWGECSATCGTSFRTRTVSCVVQGTNEPVDNGNCVGLGLVSPPAVELCTVPACPVYNFNVGSWSSCSATCGTSIRARTVECVEQTTNIVVDDSFCLERNLLRPAAQEDCVVPDCVEFTVGAWGECSATCGTSTRTRTVTCVILGTDTVVDQAQCAAAGLAAPTGVESCVVPDCYVYDIGAWGECSATCGTSFRTRVVSCVVTGTSVPVDTSNCAAAGLTAPTGVELCTVPVCPVYTFEVGSWSACSATCGVSIRARTVECLEQTTNTVVDDSFCLERNLVRPAAQEDCIVPDCVEFTIGPWGECSATCGTSTRTRTVTCVILGTDTVVDQAQCLSAGLTVPAAVESCVVPDCHTYSVGEWGECSATCGTSFRIRTVSCVVTGTVVPVDNGNCVTAGLTLPSSVELCTVPACPVYSFEVGGWSECSATCGVSIRARTVECREQTTNTLVDDSFCLERNLVRPAAQEDCLVPDCVQFTVGAWGECSATCGTSTRTRTVTCVILGTDTVVDQAQCAAAGLAAPAAVESCVVPDCYIYNIGGWGECSATCGTSFRTRAVSCVVTGTTEPVDNSNCVAAGLVQPVNVELCTVPACPVYSFNVGGWSECSATCGVSIRARTVECVEQTTNTVVDDSFCLERNLVRPAAQEDCIVPDCVAFTMGPWGECSATCGTSTRTRSVTCVILGTDTVVDQAQCAAAGLAAPAAVESCAVPECFIYNIGAWGECSATCGTSFRTRTVSCVVVGTSEPVDNGNCAAAGLTAAPSVELCTVPACPVYSFNVGTWSSCSATCGVSIRARTVECVEQTTNSVVDDSFCLERNLVRPVAQEECVVPDCVEFTVGAWGECSATCGTSTRTRVVSCVILGTDTVVDQAQCTSAGLIAPLSVEACVVPDCYTFTVGQWGECSATCGTSFRTRTVSCVVTGTTDPVDNSNCLVAGLTLPSSVELCTVPVCPVYGFEVGTWSECSATCGSSIRVRTVECREQTTDTLVDDSFCLQLNLVRPTAQEECVVPQCVEYTVGAWGECSATCGTSTRTRSVTCVILGTDTVVDQAQCVAAGLVVPAAVESCVVPDCVAYNVGAWGECSATCGTSFRTRTVTCVVAGTTTPVDNGNCLSAGLTTPSSVELCTVPVCPVYEFNVGTWSSCSATCGTSIRVRTVQCLELTTNTVVDDSFCLQLNLVRPADQEECLVPLCVGFIVSEWGQCSATCGSSFRSRTVTCVDQASGNVVSDTLCTNAGLVPVETVEICVVPVCNEYFVGAWGECSATCGTSVRVRDVYCVNVGTNVQVDESLCVIDGLIRPADSEVCVVPDCIIPVFSYTVGEFGVCDCDTRIRIREVNCIRIYGTSVTPATDAECIAYGLTTPTTTEACVPLNCPAYWYTSEWSECSVTCGCGVHNRIVQCRTDKDDPLSVVDEARCAEIARPIAQEECHTVECPEGFGCGSVYRTQEGQLTSPLYLNSNYPRDIDCVTTIEVQSGFHIAITVIDMDIEFDDNCEFDYLKITDTATNLSETHCGPLAETHEYTSVGNTVTLEFVTDSSIEGRGYALTWSAVPN